MSKRTKRILVKDLENPAIDSNVAAKKSAKNIALEQNMVAILDSLIGNLSQAERVAKEANARAGAYADQCAKLLGLDPKDWTLNWDAKAFVPKNSDANVTRKL